MKKLTLIFAALTLMVAPITVANAQAKVAHIEFQKLISEMPEVVSAQKVGDWAPYTSEMENTYKEFQTKAQTYAADAANQTEITNQARQKELETMQQNIQQYQQTVSQELQKKSVEMMRPLIDKAKASIDKISAELGFEFVLDSSTGGSVLTAKGKDLMAEVKKDLGF